MTGPDVRVVIAGLPAVERLLELLFRERARAEAETERLLAELARLERELRRLEEELRRA